MIARLRNQDSVYVRFWQFLRNLLLPLLIAFVIARQILSVSGGTTQARLLDTAVWIAIGVVSVAVLQAVGKASKNETRLEAEIPALVRGLLRMLVIVMPGYYILAVIWGVALGKLFAALGVGSVAIALALQDTLSNLVSGLLLTLDRPFEVGDQIMLDNNIGKVLDLNWRSVRVQVSGRDVVTVPNSVLSKTAIYNYTTLDPSYRDVITVGFAYDMAPNRCIRVLEEAAATSPFILQEPRPLAVLEDFEANWIRYDLFVYVGEFKGSVPAKMVRSDLRTRIYYAAQRERLVMPYMVEMMPPPAVTNGETLRTFMQQQIRLNALFRLLSDATLQLIASATQVQLYGRDEQVIQFGKLNTSLYLILSGEAEMSTQTSDGTRPTLMLLTVGDIFGEMALMGNRPGLVTVRALTDVQVLSIPKNTVSDVVGRHAQFAIQFDRLVDDRRALICARRESPPTSETERVEAAVS